MTKRRLPEADLANICNLPEDTQRRRLEAKRQFRPPYSLNPTRRNLSALAGVVTPMFPDANLSREEKLRSLVSAIKDDDERRANVKRAEAILDFMDASVPAASSESLRSHRISIDYEVKLSHNLLLQIDNNVFVPFFDLRKSGKLTSRGRDFVFAMNYHMIIDQDIDYSDYGLVILDYWEDKKGDKGLTPYFFTGEPAYSFQELTDMIATTHRIWLEVLDARKNTDRDDDSDAGPLFGAL